MTDATGELRGLCIAVQVKDGTSFRLADGYQIKPKNRHRRLWHSSTVTVFGITRDPDGSLYWLNISDVLRRNGQNARLLVYVVNQRLPICPKLISMLSTR